MKHRDRVVVMDPPVPGSTIQRYTGNEGWKSRPEVGEEIIVADVGGSGKVALGRVLSHDKTKHTFDVLILREYSYAEEDQ